MRSRSVYRHFIKRLTILLAAFVLIASTCKKEAIIAPEGVQLNTPFEIPLDGKVLMQSENIELSVDEITDVRCPSDVQCVWAGNAKVNMVIRSGSTNQQASFCIGQCENRYQSTDTLNIEYNNSSYSLILTEVKPYPGTGKKLQSAVFILQRK